MLRGILFFVLVLAMVALRRPNHFTYAAPWIEDGSIVLGQTLSLGWSSIILPLQGYLIIPARFVSLLAVWISFEHYAIVSILIACVVNAAVITAVALAPTSLPHRTLCALGLACLPIDPEVYATPLYTFWWASIPLFRALLWKNDAVQWPRMLLAAIAGVSSPLVVLLSPLFLLRAALDRTIGNAVVAVVVVAFAIIQFVHLNDGGATSLSLSLSTLVGVVSEIIGYPISPLGFAPGFVWGAVTLAALAVGLVIVPASDSPYYALLGLALGAAGVGMAQRVDVYILDALSAGPRYFFFPVTAMLWLLFWMLTRGVGRWRFLALIPLVVLVPWTIRTYVRWHDPLPKTWEQQARECAATAGTYDILVHFDGGAERAWTGTLNGPDCRRAITQSLIR